MIPDFTGAFTAMFILGVIACLAVFGLGWLVVWLIQHIAWVSA